MYAAAFGHREIVLLILAAFRQLHHVAFQGQRNGQGLTAWQLAESNGYEDIAALLKVETGVFPRPSGPSTFVPAHPLDLDRPPTPTETRSIRSSFRRSKSSGKATTSGPGPTDPLPPPSQVVHCDDCHQVVAPRRRRGSRGSSEATGAFRRERGPRVCVCSEVGDSDQEDAFLGRNVTVKRDVEGTRKLASETSSGLNTKGETGLTGDQPSKRATGLISGHINKGATGLSGDHPGRGATGLISGTAIKAPIGTSAHTKGATGTSGTRKDSTGPSSGSTTKGSTEESSDNSSATSGREHRGGGALRSIIGWTRNIDASADSKRAQGERWRAKSEPVRIGAADADERRVLEELMQGLSVSCSPGSGNEGDTESLMECERPAVECERDLVRMSSTSRKIAPGAAVPSSQPMPRIGLGASTRSLNRSIQHLVQEDVENRPEHRPPTPARPSLPTLLPGRLLDVSLSSSVSSTKSEGRISSQSRRVTFTAFPRSSSEPRSLAASPRPQDDDDADEDAPMDLLDASTRSEGWDHLRGARGRGPSFATSSEGHVVPLPPINRPRYSEAGGKGRSSVRGRGAGGGGTEDNVLSVAKKTLEQLETVLAPKETAALPRTIPRTRTSHQIHMET